MDFVLEIHAEEICNDPVSCIIAQVRIGIMNLLNLNDRIFNIEQKKVTYVLIKGIQIVGCLICEWSHG